MASIKLTYYKTRGRGETSRLLLAASGKEWENNRFHSTEWPALKPNAPFGQAPFLEYNGQTYGQSVAIANFLAREFGFYGKTNQDAAVIDQVVQLVQEIIADLVIIYDEKDEAKKEELTEKLRSEALPKYLGIFQKLLRTNGSTGFFVGKGLSLADIVLFDILITVQWFIKSDIPNKDDYPEVEKVRANVAANPGIKKYMASRATDDEFI